MVVQDQWLLPDNAAWLLPSLCTCQSTAVQRLDCSAVLQAHPFNSHCTAGLGLQHANSYLEGLSAVPFPDPYSGSYKWLEALEKQVGAGQGCRGKPRWWNRLLLELPHAMECTAHVLRS